MKKVVSLTTFKLAVFVFLLMPSYAFAGVCTCEERTPKMQEERADAIFTGKVLTPNEEANNGLWTTISIISTEKASEEAEILMNIIELGSEQRVRLAQKLSDCNFIFEQDKTYRVFAIVTQTEKKIAI